MAFRKKRKTYNYFSRNKSAKEFFARYNSFLPPCTHSETGNNGLKKWVTLRDAIECLPTLAATEGQNEDETLPWHIVPIMKKKSIGG